MPIEFMYLDQCDVKDLGDEKVEVSGPGVMTGEMQSVIVNEESLEKWRSGELLAQEAFPELSDDEREFLISGIEIGNFNEFLDL